MHLAQVYRQAIVSLTSAATGSFANLTARTQVLNDLLDKTVAQQQANNAAMGVVMGLLQVRTPAGRDADSSQLHRVQVYCRSRLNNSAL